MKLDPLHTRFESILSRELDLNHRNVRLIGSSSSVALAAFLSNNYSSNFKKLPHVVVVPRLQDAHHLAQNLSFFNASLQAEIFEHYDVSPYSGLYPKPQFVAQRLRFLFRAQNAGPGQIFILPVGSLLQKTFSFQDLKKATFTLSKGFDLPAKFPLLLSSLGYIQAPFVEDVGQFSMRGGILDVFSPAHDSPVRLELFGDTIESLRSFSTENQMSSSETRELTIIPCREFIWNSENLESVVARFKKTIHPDLVDRSELEETLRSLTKQIPFPGIDFLISCFNETLSTALEHFSTDVFMWFLDPDEIAHHADQIFSELKEEYSSSEKSIVRPPPSDYYFEYDSVLFSESNFKFYLSPVDTEFLPEDTSIKRILYASHSVQDLTKPLSVHKPGTDAWSHVFNAKISSWIEDRYSIFVSTRTQSQAERVSLLLKKFDYFPVISSLDDRPWSEWREQAARNPKTVFVVPRPLSESVRLDEEFLVFLKDEDLLGKKQRQRSSTSLEDFQKKAKSLNFGDLKPGDCVVHTLHGIGIFDGLKTMTINGAQSEFIQIEYKDKDRLYLPVYRVGQLQKYSGSAQTTVLDKLGGPGWEKTKSKVKNHLREIALDLLKIYSARAQLHRNPFSVNEKDFSSFEMSFQYDETDDQVRAINDLIHDLTSSRPMDRLICGDVGYGKTEVAMRAAFLVAEGRRQVAVLAPTTVLTFQHQETFKKRFQGWPFEIRTLNRFVSNSEIKKTLSLLKDGKVDIVIGTHRLLSKDVEFKDLGLLIVDEEQKFGVAHKEKIRRLRSHVDTLAMSATPIPRTLNMSLMGVRDLSIINTAPVDRLPTRTFIMKWDESTIRRAIQSELSRGGQVYFIHNRIQGIYSLADEIKKLVPEARIRVGHGQMEESELESTMISFFNHEIDVLVCTAIVESGMDVPRANTMFIDQAHMMGLSQLYQLRGRVGRSKQRAYCYLILPRGKTLDKTAQERLKVIQENTALGSGIKIAQYDLELRGAGNLLGEEQSGHIDAVGYEMYMELLNEAVHEARGETPPDTGVDPEINLRIPALIPDTYIPDLRIRLSYYKALSEIRSHDDLEKIELELKDQFGPIPEPTLNLMGLMLIRRECRDLGIRDLSSGTKNISLIFTEKTPLKSEVVVRLAMRENKKYSVTPDNRLNIRMNSISWPLVYEELSYLQKLRTDFC